MAQQQPARADAAQVRLLAHWQLLQHDLAAACAARLSLRKAWLAAVLLDHLPDRIAEACRSANQPLPHGAPDLPAYRATLRSRSPALALLFDLVAMQPQGPGLELRLETVPSQAVGDLPVEEFMISLYNDHQVQRLMITRPDRSVSLAHELLAEAMHDLGQDLQGLS